MALLCRKIVTMPLIMFEGSEGCGKSTQVKRLTARLEKSGIAASVFREPGGAAIGEAIRHLLQHSEEDHAMTPETELLLFEASRSQLVREKIQPALRRGGWVICDATEQQIWNELAQHFPDLGKYQTPNIKLQTS